MQNRGCTVILEKIIIINIINIIKPSCTNIDIPLEEALDSVEPDKLVQFGSRLFVNTISGVTLVNIYF